MKRLIVSLLVLSGVAVFVSGCTPKEKVTAEPKVEAPAKAAAPAAPKDHPAH